MAPLFNAMDFQHNQKQDKELDQYTETFILLETC